MVSVFDVSYHAEGDNFRAVGEMEDYTFIVAVGVGNGGLMIFGEGTAKILRGTLPEEGIFTNPSGLRISFYKHGGRP